ncbi:cytochrome P450 [Rickenella mellea]|uniref:Cytochrome P450 n=1 Tax=Rickenella mellea TaxID=50990 RepID=A0A4Y7Q594_9AGAM|nr:cytochrome P450 [Rickenella mellea]
MEEIRSLSNGYIAAVLVIVFITGFQYLQARRHDIKVPAVGCSGFFSSYVAAFRWISHAKAILEEGYVKHKHGIFKVSQPDRWQVIITGPKLIEEVRRAPSNKLSLKAGLDESLAMGYTMGQELIDNSYHVAIIRTQLTRNLSSVFPQVRNEIVHSFQDLIPLTDDWVGYPAVETFMTIVARTSNRIFVGLPTCRDPDYIKLNIEYTVQVFKAATLIGLTPSFLRPIVGRLLSPARSGVRRGLKHLRPIIEERLRKYEEYGLNYPDKPNDMLTWMMDEAEGNERGVEILCLRMLSVNMTALHTSSMSLAQAMFHLASKPQYIEPMRVEVERVIQEDGWTKEAMTKMRKVDSFLKETQRVNGLSFLSTLRLAVDDYTFSDGTFIPKGTLMSVASAATHNDPELYENANEFQGFRFADLREDGVGDVKHQMVSTSPEYLPFGHGSYACPGRFFAANELKAMMAHIVLNYDVKMEPDGVRPQDIHFTLHCAPNLTAKILFRKRQQ